MKSKRFFEFIKGLLCDKSKSMEEDIISKDRILQGLAEAISILLYEQDTTKGFSLALGKLGEVTAVDRVYIFENHPHHETGKFSTSQRFEWSINSVEPQINNPDLQDINYEELGIMRWYNTLSKGKVLSGAVKDFPESEKHLFTPQGIISLLVVPIIIDNEFYGFIGFDDCHKNRLWSKVEESTLLVVAATIGAVIKRKQIEKELQRAVENDFKRTIKNLQNLVFKIKKDEKGEFIHTLFEGKLAEFLGESTESVYGKSVWDMLPEEAAAVLSENLVKAFEGKICGYELKIDNRTYYDTLSPIIENDIVTEVIGSAIDITEYKKAQDHINFLAYYDTLTELPNRVLFKDRLRQAISHEKRNNQLLSVMFLDLDRFKNINDTLGHTAGDTLLKEVAARLKQIVQEDDTIARMGGDEFTLIFTDIKTENEIVHIAERIMSVFRKPFYIEGHEIYVTASVGISMYPSDGEQFEVLVKNADMAMYRAKEYGRNNYQFFTEGMNEKVIKRLEVESSLRKALEKDEFILHYQPQLDSTTEKIVGCEALIRWNRPGLGLVYPGDFIPLAEETGLIVPIGEWVFIEACSQLKKWHNDGKKDLKMAVNISAQQFEQQDLVELVEKTLEETGIDPKFLEIEITESIIMKSTERTASIFSKLKRMGIKISIDDFGTGFSSLGYLQKFSSDILKIDRSFIQNIPENSRDQAIVTAIINMAHILGLVVIAEGVETEEQLSFLKSVNCDEIQGYYISRPVSSNELENML